MPRNDDEDEWFVRVAFEKHGVLFQSADGGLVKEYRDEADGNPLLFCSATICERVDVIIVRLCAPLGAPPCAVDGMGLSSVVADQPADPTHS